MARMEYSPPGKVAAEFMRSNKFFRGIRGPVGSGKSVTCVVELFRRAWEQEPSIIDGVRYSRWAIIRNTVPELKTTTIKSWLEWLPEAEWGSFNYAPPMTHHIVKDGRDIEFIFLSLDREDDVKKLYSLELTGAWVNEARFVPKAIFDVLTERVRRYPAARHGGPTFAGIIADTNSPDPEHWWAYVSGDMPLPDDIPEEEAQMLQRPPDWEFFTQPPAVFEVKDQNGSTAGWRVNPKCENLSNLNKGYYEQMVAGKRRSMVLRDVGNQYSVDLDGRIVYQSYSPTLHNAMEPLPIIRGMPVYVGVDFGLTPAAVFGQTHFNSILVQRELTTQSLGAKEFARMCKRLLETVYADSDVYLYGDPSGDYRRDTDENTPFLIFHAAGLPIQPAPFENDFLMRTEAVDRLFTTLTAGKPRCVLDPSVRHLRKACAGGYHYPRLKVTGLTQYADRPAKNMSSHVAEAFQYLALGMGEGDNVLKNKQMAQGVKHAKQARGFFARRAQQGKNYR